MADSVEILEFLLQTVRKGKIKLVGRGGVLAIGREHQGKYLLCNTVDVAGKTFFIGLLMTPEDILKEIRK